MPFLLQSVWRKLHMLVNFVIFGLLFYVLQQFTYTLHQTIFHTVMVPLLINSIKRLNWKWSSGQRESWERLLLATDISTTCGEAIFRVKWLNPVYYKRFAIQSFDLHRSLDRNNAKGNANHALTYWSELSWTIIQ